MLWDVPNDDKICSLEIQMQSLAVNILTLVKQASHSMQKICYSQPNGLAG